MNGIVKRRKTSDYAQIHNNTLQNLEDIRSIGLISHLMSLPETWEIKKMQLYAKFGRGPITTAISELESKKYWVDIKYREGKKNFHYYNASDLSFSDDEVIEFMNEVNDAGFKILDISEPFKHLLSSVDFQQLKNGGDSSIVGFQQLKINCSKSIVENKHLLNIYKEKQQEEKNIKKENKKIDNYQEAITNSIEFSKLLTDACNNFYGLFAINRWNKKDWNSLIEKFVNETIESGRYKNVPREKIDGYAFASIKRMTEHTDYKRSDEFAEYQESMKEVAATSEIDFSIDDLVPFLKNKKDDDMPY